MFIHGLWKSAAIWDRWIEKFAREGYRPIAPRWPGERNTAAEPRAQSSRSAGVGFSEIVEHFESEVAQLDEPPICVGHSFGALIAERMLASGLATASVAIDPAQSGSALPGSIEALRSDFTADCQSPAGEAITLTPEQFRAAFTPESSPMEAQRLYELYAIPGYMAPLLDVADASFRLIPEPVAEGAGPLLLLHAIRDPDKFSALLDPSIVRFRDSVAVEVSSEFVGRGHSLVFDDQWESVADFVIDWLQQKGL